MIAVGLVVYKGPRTHVLLNPDGTVGFNFHIPGVKPTYDEKFKARVSCGLCGVPAAAYISIVGQAVDNDRPTCLLLQCRGRNGKGSPDGDHVWVLDGGPLIKIPDSKPQFPF